MARDRRSSSEAPAAVGGVDHREAHHQHHCGAPSGTIGSKLKALRRRGKSTAPQVTALLLETAKLNLDPPPPSKHAVRVPPREPSPPPPEPSSPTMPPPPLPPPPPPPMLPPSMPLPTAESPRVDYIDAGDHGVAFWATTRHPEIPGYRGRPGGDGEEERYWNPAQPPCVPYHRSAHLFANSSEAARAAMAAERVEVTCRLEEKMTTTSTRRSLRSRR